MSSPVQHLSSQLERHSDTAVTAAQKREIAIDSVSLDRYGIGIDPADWRENWERMPDTFSRASDPRMIDQDEDYPTLVKRYFGAADGSVDSTVLNSLSVWSGLV